MFWDKNFASHALPLLNTGDNELVGYPSRRGRQACPAGVTGNGLATAPPRDSPKSLTFPP